MKNKRLHGFTLIELLVVIAIVAILAAILFPVFNMARQAARQSQCSENTRQLSRACILYSDDYGGHGPTATLWGTDTYGSKISNSPLRKYFSGGVNTGAITCCPSDDRKDHKDPTNTRKRQWSITYNNYLSTGNAWSPLTFDGTLYSLFTSPGKIPMWICESADATDPSPVNDTNFCNTDLTSNRHNGYAPVTFLDGHAGRLKSKLEWNHASWHNPPTDVNDYIFHPGRPSPV